MNSQNYFKKSEEMYSKLYTSMNEGVAIHRVIYADNIPVDYEIVDVNPSYEYILGLKPGEVIGKMG